MDELTSLIANTRGLPADEIADMIRKLGYSRSFSYVSQPSGLVALDEDKFREWLKSHHCPDFYIDHLAPEFITKFGQPQEKMGLDKDKLFKIVEPYFANNDNARSLVESISSTFSQPVQGKMPSVEELSKMILGVLDTDMHHTPKINANNIAQAIHRLIGEK